MGRYHMLSIKFCTEYTFHYLKIKSIYYMENIIFILMFLMTEPDAYTGKNRLFKQIKNLYGNLSG